MLLLFLYSMEPSLYSELQEASRKCDKQKLNQYGPWAVAILQIFENNSEQNRLDRLKTGKEIGVNNRYGFFAGSVLLFRFGWLPMTQIDEWKDISQKESKWDKKICLPSVVSSFYTSLDSALEHSQHPDPNNKDVPVLFVVCMQNYEKFEGFRLNSYKYSAYPQEEEVLLPMTTQLYVVKSDLMTADTIRPNFMHMNGNSFFVVHLFNRS